CEVFCPPHGSRQSYWDTSISGVPCCASNAESIRTVSAGKRIAWRSWFPFSSAGGGSGTADRDVSIGGAAAHLDGLVGLFGPVGVLQQVAHTPESGVHRQPSGGALGDADLEIASRGLERDRTADHLAEADAAVGRLCLDTGAGPVDGDLAIRRTHPHVAGD